MNQLFVIVQSLRRRPTDILDVGESTLDVGELTVGETTRRRNDRNSNQMMNVISEQKMRTERYRRKKNIYESVKW